MAETYEGSCFCGAVKIAVDGPAMAQGYCHCGDCRAWSAAPLSSFGIWPADQVRILEGEDRLVRFDRSGKATRMSCATCGGAVMTEIVGAGLTDVYPPLLRGLPFEPAMHVHYGERIVDFPDGLPKFRDMPAEAGGSGEVVED